MFLTHTATLWILLALILLTSTLIGFVLFFALKRNTPKPDSAAKVARGRRDESFKSSFQQAIDLIETNIAARSERYSIPWVLLFNEGETRHNLPIEQAGVAAALSPDTVSVTSGQAIQWHFFDRGIVLDVLSEFLGSPDDETVADRPWFELLGLCQKYRPQRPVDSVIITIPIDLLLDGSHDAKLELESRARLAHRRLWLAQNRFAMRFAVYVVITRADKLQGFASFARALPDSQRASMLGWSTPYDLATVYQSKWVEQAVDCMTQIISNSQAEMFANGVSVADIDAFYLLPVELAKAQASLQQYMDELLRPSAYHEPFYLRGIYLTGDSGPMALQHEHSRKERRDGGEPADEDEDMFSSVLLQEPAFLKDLIERKVFAEYGLARPVVAGAAVQRRTAQVMKWATLGVALVWGVGLAVASVRIGGQVKSLSGTLGQLAHDRSERAVRRAHGDEMSPEWYKQRSQALITTMERSDERNLWAVAIPGSWPMFSELSGQLQREYERAFSEIAVTTVSRVLEQKLASLTGATHTGARLPINAEPECSALQPQAASAAPKLTLVPEETAEYQLLAQYVGDAEQLESALGTFTRLRKTGTAEPADFHNLIRYTLDADLPGEYRHTLRYFRDASRQPGANDALALAPGMLRCAYVKNTDRLYQRMFDRNDLLRLDADVAGLQRRLFEHGSDPLPLADPQSGEGFRALLDKLNQLDALVNTPRAGWLHDKTLKLGPSYDGLVLRASKLAPLGADTQDRAGRAAQQGFERFGILLNSQINMNAGASVAWSDKDKRYMLRPDLFALRAGLTSLLAQDFMTPSGGKTFASVQHRGNVNWDIKLLDQAVALQDVRRKYLNDDLARLPAAMRPALQREADRHFADHVVSLVADAQSTPFNTSTEALDLQNASDASLLNFEAARPRLVQILGLLSELNANPERQQLIEIVATDAGSRLRAIDDALLRAEPFVTRDGNFAWWQGSTNPILYGYGVTDPIGLTQYLAQQFSRIEALSQQAAPLVALLQGAGQRGEQTGLLVERWTAIGHELERYKAKNPNSSLAQLEQFILAMGTDLTRDNCVERLAGHFGQGKSADFFTDRRNQLFAKLQMRCHDIQADESRIAWNRLSDSFNHDLAGRFPFMQGSPAEGQAAELNDVAAFLHAYDKAATPGRSLQPGNAASSVNRFMDAIGRVRTFLAPLFPADEATAAGYDVLAVFRVNQGAEVDGNKIVDWALSIGDQTLQQRDGAKPLTWNPGMPVTLTLRLAKDATIEPLPDSRQPAMRVEGKSVSFHVADPWALVSLIQQHRDPDANARGDARAQVLRFEFPTRAIGADGHAPPGQAPGIARVFVKLSLLAPGKHSSLAWPSFPTKAPGW